MQPTVIVAVVMLMLIVTSGCTLERRVAMLEYENIYRSSHTISEAIEIYPEDDRHTQSAHRAVDALHDEVRAASPDRVAVGARMRELAFALSELQRSSQPRADGDYDPDCVSACFDTYDREVEACDGDFQCELAAQRRLDQCLTTCRQD